jgi:hypothetical protein
MGTRHDEVFSLGPATKLISDLTRNLCSTFCNDDDELSHHLHQVHASYALQQGQTPPYILRLYRQNHVTQVLAGNPPIYIQDTQFSSTIPHRCLVKLAFG